MSIIDRELARLRKDFGEIYPDDVLRADCPSSNKIIEGVRNELPPEELKELVGHMAACPVCAGSWKMALKLERKHPLQRWWQRAGIVAAAAILIYMLIPPAAVERSQRMLELELLTGSEPLPRNEFRLRWTEFEGATYDIEVTSRDSRVRGRARGLGNPEFIVPGENLNDLLDGAVLLVRIDAYLPDQRRVSSRFEVLLR